jgi:hypothetical protein
MPKFRKKPIIIDAFQMTRTHRVNFTNWPGWLMDASWRSENPMVSLTAEPGEPLREIDKLMITTLEGILLVEWDDWIIKGIKGELYPCKPDIFAATYEEVLE